MVHRCLGGAAHARTSDGGHDIRSAWFSGLSDLATYRCAGPIPMDMEVTESPYQIGTGIRVGPVCPVSMLASVCENLVNWSVVRQHAPFARGFPKQLLAQAQ